MKGNKYKYLALPVILVNLLMLSCKDELTTVTENSGIPLEKGRILVDFDFQLDYDTPATRATGYTKEDDGWSYGTGGFANGDVAGVFARSGNNSAPNGNGPLINVPMTFEVVEYEVNGKTDQYQSLTNDSIIVNPADMSIGNSVFMYYPYSPELGNLSNYDQKNRVVVVNDSGGYPHLPGLELRVKAPDGSIRCRDVAEVFTVSNDNLKKGLLTGTWRHGFSEIQIMRGEGFENPPDDKKDITVVLSEGYSHFRIVSVSDYVRWTVQLHYEEDYKFEGSPMSEDECKRWVAWQGENYKATQGNGFEDLDGVPAWYVMVPSVYTASSSKTYMNRYAARPTVSYIELYDNNGYRQQVTSFSLKTSATATDTKSPYPYYRFPIIISMTELGPVARPVEIGEWDEEGDDKDLTDERTVGIHDVNDYNTWAYEYNSYVSDPGNYDLNGDNSILHYGDLIDGVWHFYITGDIDFSSQSVSTVTNLKDILESGNEIYNITLANMNVSGPLFSQITGNGGIKNITFKNVYLSSTGTNPVGCLAGSITNSNYTSTGSVLTNVNLNQSTVISNGPVGLVVGRVQGFSIISGCNFNGFLMGASTSDNYVLGENPDIEPKYMNTDFSNIIFTNN